MKNVMQRRSLLAFAAAAPIVTALPAAAQQTATSEKVPFVTPELEFVYEAVVDIAEGVDLGAGPVGERRMVPITGGTFEGPKLRGTVLAGGVDRQLVRPDGVRLLDAFYEMQTDDGIYLTVRNRMASVPDRTRFSHLVITAPEGRHSWLNDRVFIGTIGSLRPDRAAVVIRVFTPV
ncbi:DUF3237 domain-containing protein [Falsirhodobacter deserti]|uniref:DUF3237 domain-containing protein n=1 Tax=Falsirhodobacter deserti TaxID=1365611 RepID=UPI000FE39457|nr:DUF3237 domain-containing protein [Falsirhodobacter deserti]